MPQQWVVVGGSDKGGILVRESESTTSEALQARLETRATVEELALRGDRLQFKLLTGDGPPTGWVSVKISGKILMDKAQAVSALGVWPPPGGQWRPIPDDIWATFPKLEDGATLRPQSIKEFKEQVNDDDAGEYWGIKFPFTPKMLQDMGPDWLTLAMHTAGTLRKDDSIAKFVEMDVKAEDVTKQDAENAKWGGAGIKILLKVAYKNGVTEKMFIKMPHEYTGTNERTKNSFNNGGMMDWSEATFYNVCGGRFGDLPFKSPKMFFCDMCRRTTNFINVVEHIPYAATGTMEVLPGQYYPAPEKYRDWALPNNGIELYYAHTKALAQFFGWSAMMRKRTDQLDRIFADALFLDAVGALHKEIAASGAYNSQQREAAIMKSMFEKDKRPMVESMGFPPATAKGFLDLAYDFVTKHCPQAFPGELLDKEYLADFRKEADEMSKHCAEMSYYMTSVPEYFSLVHPNAQVDNAFYWKNDVGTVQCGLLDWGGASYSSIPNCIGNGWIGAEPEVMEEHEEKLVKLFVDEYANATGVRFDCADLLLQIKLAQAAVFYGCCANVGMCMRILKKEEWSTVTGRKDPRVDQNFLLRCYFVQVYLFLKMWGLKNSPYLFYKRWKRKVKLPSHTK